MISRTCSECIYGERYAKAKARVAELEAQLSDARGKAERYHALWSRVGVPGADVPPLPWKEADNA